MPVRLSQRICDKSCVPLVDKLDLDQERWTVRCVPYGILWRNRLFREKYGTSEIQPWSEAVKIVPKADVRRLEDIHSAVLKTGHPTTATINYLGGKVVIVAGRLLCGSEESGCAAILSLVVRCSCLAVMTALLRSRA